MFSIVTPCFNSGKFLRPCLESIVAQRRSGEVDVELIVMDGGSTDETPGILEEFRDEIDVLVSEPDAGPADAINKGLRFANGEFCAWLNADDRYQDGALARVKETMDLHPSAAFCFGHCPIVDPEGGEIRSGVTSVKEFFYPLSSRFTFQCINYISQPAMVFRRQAFLDAGPLRTDLTAAWDYEFLLRLWRQGNGVRIPRPHLASFCWHPASISGQTFRIQFREEFDCARMDAGRFSLQTFLHRFVYWGIVGCYSLMTRGETS